MQKAKQPRTKKLIAEQNKEKNDHFREVESEGGELTVVPCFNVQKRYKSRKVYAERDDLGLW